MRVTIRYFSGTGNTEFIAQQLESHWRASGHSTDRAPIDTSALVDSPDLLVVGGPIHAGTCPSVLLGWIRQLPRASGTRALVFTTSAGLLNAFGVEALAAGLESRGYRIIGKETFVMPRNFYFGSFAPMDPEYCLQLIDEAKLQAAAVAQSSLTEETERPASRQGAWGRRFSGALFSGITRFMGRSYAANENCTRCRLCVKHCPTQNITLGDHRVKFGWNCTMCTRCIHSCPSHAITYGGRTYPQYRLKALLRPD